MRAELRNLVLGLWVFGGLAMSALGAEGSFYKQPNLFNFWHPNEKVASQFIERFGPVGMSIELRLPPFQMVVGKLEEGGPAEATGKLETGQKIESINGQVLKDIDPRIQLAQIIAAAEASDGKITFVVQPVGSPSGTGVLARPGAGGERQARTPVPRGEEVVVQLPVLGAYSKTWPLDCPKSDKIVRNMAHWVKTEGGYDLDTQGWKSLNGFGMLFLLSTGDESDLDHVRGWVKQVVAQYKDEEKILLKPWVFGSAAIPLAEYYLRTGDKSILSVIQKLVRHVEGTMYNGAWSGRGGLVFGYMAGGHMNAAGIHGPTFLMLAKECGVEVNDDIMLASLRQFYRFAGKGSVPYGDHFPETYFIDNGKTGALAFTMAAAAALTPKGEKSVYAKARDVSALRGFYGTNYMLTGHTGGGIGEVWRGPAMGFLYEKEPAKYRAFMDGRQWHLEMSRRFNGSFGILDGTGRYDTPSTWGQMMALQYTIPRKTLRLSGAPRGKWSKPYQLPERPWGTKADDNFCNITPAVDLDGEMPEFDDSLEGGTINGVERMFMAAEDTKALGLQYCLHPDHEMRREIGAGYVKRNEQDGAVVAMLKHKDARVRRAALAVLYSVHKGTHVLPAERLTDEMVERVIGMVNDPEESWWVTVNALQVMSVLPKEKTAPHVDRLLSFLDQDEWWLQHAALQALAPLAVDEATYAKILPKIGELIVNSTRSSATGPVGDIAKRLATAGPKVQAAGVAMLTQAYTDFPTDLLPPAGVAAAEQLKGDMQKYVIPVSLRTIAGHIMKAPDGLNILYPVAKARNPQESLPYKQNYLWADYATFSDELKTALKPIVLDELVPEFVARNLGALQGELTKGGGAHSKLGELAGLYRKAGASDYEWRNFGPDRNAMKFHYFMGDTTEQKDWNQADFDPAKAGWKVGMAPFGEDGGKLRTEQSGCSNPICRCGDPMHTLWNKGDLLITGTFKFPKMKEGHSYRLLISGASHVGMSGNVQAYINGRAIASTRGGPRRGQGGRARGALIPQNLVSAFQGQEVVISASCSPRKHQRNRMKGNFVTIWIEEMKNPPVSDELAWEGLKFISLQSSEWQQDQDSDDGELSTEEGLFRFDGTFVANESVLGSWKPIGKVDAIDDFKPGAEIDASLPRYRSITFKDSGFTDTASRYWSGDTLMELGHGAGALKMKTKTIDGAEYLFIETGGFTFYHERQHYKHPRTWHSPWFVLKR